MARAVPVASGTADVQGYTGSTTLMGVTVTAAAATTVYLRNGTDAADPIVATARLAAAGTFHAMLPAVDCPDGVFVDRDGTASELVLYTY